MSQPWFIEYRPSRFTELCFDDDSHIRAIRWLKEREKGLLHISGPHGCGKTVLVHAIAKALKYNVLEVTNETLDNIKTGIAHCGRGINNLPSLLLVDEDFFSSLPYLNAARLLSTFSKHLPVILTSTDSRCKEAESIRIGRPGVETMLKMVETVHKKARRTTKLSNSQIAKIAERCNFDMRAALNYCQLYNGSHQSISNIHGTEYITTTISMCSRIFKRRMRMEEIESRYDSSLLNMCLNNLYTNCRDADFVARCLRKASTASCLPSSYHFLELDEINRQRGEYTYSKNGYSQREIAVCDEERRCSTDRDLRYFISCISRKCKTPKSLKHLQQILRNLKPEELSVDDGKVLHAKENTEKIVSVKFKYKYNPGASNAVRRDVSVSEITG